MTDKVTLTLRHKDTTVCRQFEIHENTTDELYKMSVDSLQFMLDQMVSHIDADRYCRSLRYETYEG